MSLPARNVTTTITEIAFKKALTLFRFLILEPIGLLIFTQHAFALGLFCNGQSYEFESQPSPTNQWILERHRLDDCTDTGELWLSIRRPSEQAAQTKNLLLPLLERSSVVTKWLDDTTLLLAASQESELGDKREFFRNVHITYSIYPTDPDRFRDKDASTVLRTTASFEYLFESLNDQGPVPSVGCQLKVETEGNNAYLKRLLLRLYVGKNTAVKAFDPAIGKTRSIKEQTVSTLLLSTDRDYAAEPHIITSAAISEMPILAPGNAERNFRAFETPSGKVAPGWQVMWNVKGEDVKDILQKLSSETFEIKLGFWLDGTELIYSNIGSRDAGGIKEFEQCITENKIF